MENCGSVKTSDEADSHSCDSVTILPCQLVEGEPAAAGSSDIGRFSSSNVVSRVQTLSNAIETAQQELAHKAEGLKESAHLRLAPLANSHVMEMAQQELAQKTGGLMESAHHRLAPLTAMSVMTKIGWIKDLFSDIDVQTACEQPAVALLSDVVPMASDDLHVILTATLEYKDMRDCKLSLCRLRRSDQVPTQQVLYLKSHLRKYVRNESWALCWPIHAPEVSRAVQHALNAIDEVDKEGSTRQRIRFLACTLRLWRPKRYRDFLKVIHDVYGPDMAYVISRNEFFVQYGWFLMPLVVAFLVLDADPSRPFGDPDGKRIIWEIGKALTLLWGGLVVWKGVNTAVISDTKLREPKEEAQSSNPDFNRGRSTIAWRGILFIVEFILIAMFIFFVLLSLSLSAQLVIFVNFDWGGCKDVEKECMSAAATRGLAGMVAEAGVTVFVAALFQLLLWIGSELAPWFAWLKNRRTLQDYEFSRDMLTVVLNGIVHIGTFGIFAMFFVPQWEEPRETVTQSCDDLIGGDSNLYCMQRKLPVDLRRKLFATMFTGPFVFTPFVKIALNAIVPFVAHRLDQTVNNFISLAGMNQRAGLGQSFRVLTRVLALAFLYDGGTVDGTHYIHEGLPFKDIEVDSASVGGGAALHRMSRMSGATAVTKEEEKVKQALQQGLLKRFEPRREVLELNLCFLLILFFAPIFPLGVIPTLLARLVECNSDVFQMLFLRQRLFPSTLGFDVMQHSQAAFFRAALFAAVGWSAALTCTTYNDDLWRWKTWEQYAFLAGLLAWLYCAVRLAFMRKLSVDDDSVEEDEGAEAENQTAESGLRETGREALESSPVRPMIASWPGDEAAE
eukprot:TRINITY_DN15151_c0_g1_i1.p1 TRINITY_DN15151_c0_g1~~TRINITY_DN15151_c0_g1_i1.p1  ORF type:complete len:844 (+),score=119.87 TRINITY_DN15151_c0_g1_i1:63-2594(+)